MKNNSQLINEIVERLKSLEPEKIILFGSYAYGNPDKDSDIDLYIVTSDNFIPSSWREKMNIKLKVSNTIKELKKIYDFDLIVHTKAMYEKFKKNNSLFSQEILKKGKIIYAKPE